MPQMSRETVEAIEKHVKPILEKAACSVCQNSQWVIAESIFEMREFFGGRNIVISTNGLVIPVVVATCHICGHTIFFNAIHVGAFKTSQVKP